MSRQSSPDLLVLQAVRLLGFAETPLVAARFGLSEVSTGHILRAAADRGWTGRSEFAGLAGWSLTESGRQHNQRLLGEELTAADGGGQVAAVHQAFLPLNAMLQRACTDWQLRPDSGNRLAANDHADPGWDAAVLDELSGIARAMGSLQARLVAVLDRFGGYSERFTAALDRARTGAVVWVDGIEVDSCHRVWFELHEDLVATLGIDRGAAENP